MSDEDQSEQPTAEQAERAEKEKRRKRRRHPHPSTSLPREIRTQEPPAGVTR